ncbi:MAG: hypothetical protein V2I51_22900, partial [Anderseniella sp.]|nr:hypothetical protein [Anderseniella sp.]
MEVSVFGLLREGRVLIGLFIGSMALLVSGSPVAQGVDQRGYQLRPGDVVAVSVWQEPGLEQLV